MLLALLQLADSALPVGAAAHSFGLETLIEEEYLTPASLAAFFEDYLQETGVIESVFVRRAWRGEALCALNDEFSARKPARESREASARMGRRLVDLFNTLSGCRLPRNLHYPLAFGAVGATLEIREESAVLAYLQQSVTSLVSACQRLMPVGQLAASGLIWNLKPAITAAAADSERLATACFAPLPELGSMRHGSLPTRLFIS